MVTILSGIWLHPALLPVPLNSMILPFESWQRLKQRKITPMPCGTGYIDAQGEWALCTVMCVGGGKVHWGYNRQISLEERPQYCIALNFHCPTLVADKEDPTAWDLLLCSYGDLRDGKYSTHDRPRPSVLHQVTFGCQKLLMILSDMRFLIFLRGFFPSPLIHV